MSARTNEAALRRQDLRQQWTLLGLLLPALAVILFVVLLPLAWLTYRSFIGETGGFSVENYTRMVEYKSYARVFAATFQVSFLTTAICILLGYPVAYCLAHVPPRWAPWLLLAVLLPCWTSLLVRTYAWLILLQRNGIINEFGINTGLWDAPIQLLNGMTGTLIGMVHIMLPFLILPLYGAIRRIDGDLLKAAASLGASPVATFWRVVFPLSLPGLVAGVLIVFMLCLGFFITPAILGGGRVILVSNQITAILENQFDWGAASALGVVLLVATLAVLSLAARLLSLDTFVFGRDR